MLEYFQIFCCPLAAFYLYVYVYFDLLPSYKLTLKVFFQIINTYIMVFRQDFAKVQSMPFQQMERTHGLHLEDANESSSPTRSTTVANYNIQHTSMYRQLPTTIHHRHPTHLKHVSKKCDFKMNQHCRLLLPAPVNCFVGFGRSACSLPSV